MSAETEIRISKLDTIINPIINLLSIKIKNVVAILRFKNSTAYDSKLSKFGHL